MDLPKLKVGEKVPLSPENLELLAWIFVFHVGKDVNVKTMQQAEIRSPGCAIWRFSGLA
jgi:hypothetical protein